MKSYQIHQLTVLNEPQPIPNQNLKFPNENTLMQVLILS